MKKDSGFTLIELLVVIAIISLLSTIVLGSLNSAREKALNTKIVSEMNALYKATQLYQLTNNEYLYQNQGVWVDEYCYNEEYFYSQLQPLVDGKFISSIPHHPANTSCDDGYNYYIYWSNFIDGDYNGFQSAEAKCGGKPINDFLIMNYTNKDIEGMGNLEYFGHYYTEYKCIGD